ncbi:MAG: hypothetical protein AVDCRST_MAG79-1248, partial [uncultured Thermoleophilia bacterium]
DASTDRQDQPRRLGHGDELGRTHQRPVRRAPAQQGLDARDLPRGDAEYRLV